MGWFSSAVNSVRSAYNSVKRAAGKAIGWMADKAEAFVGGVKRLWRSVEPFVASVQKVLTAAQMATVGIPWLSSAIATLNKGITALTTFANSPIAKKIDQAINYAIKLAKDWQENEGKADLIIEEGELDNARRHQETFRMAERESASENESHMLSLMAAINDYGIAKADLAEALKQEPADFQHYLRLRATQKLLLLSKKRFQNATSIDHLSVDDLFLVRIASDLVKKDPELSELAAKRLDKVLEEKYHKSLSSFVYEELISSWKTEAMSMAEEVDRLNNKLAKDVVQLRRLEADKKIQAELSADDIAKLEELASEVPLLEEKIYHLHGRQLDIECYANAAEGFLQLLEKTEEMLESEDRAYVLDEGEEVGRIILDVAENELSFKDLPADSRALLRDFANAFKLDANSRMESMLEVFV